MFSSGIYWGELLKHTFLDERRADYVEYLVHDLASVFLVFGSAYANQIGIGAAISIIHLISDISASFFKFLCSTKYDKITGISFIIIHMPIWFYFRNLCLPFWIYHIFTSPLVAYQPPLDRFNIFLMLNGFYLLVLEFLHIYWFVLFIKMVAHHNKTGKADDLQAKV